MFGTQNGSPFYVIGDMDYEKGIFTQKNCKILDYGFDFYAPQTLFDEKGRRIMIAWMEKWFSKMPSQEQGWAGAMTIPRELILDEDNNILKQTPVSELANLRSEYMRQKGFEIDKDTIINEQYEQISETIIDFNMKDTTAKLFGI